MRREAAGIGFDVELHVMEVPVEILISRLESRNDAAVHGALSVTGDQIRLYATQYFQARGVGASAFLECCVPSADRRSSRSREVMPETIDSTPGELTPFLALDETLSDYALTSRDALQENFVGLYLIGSLAIGDFDLTSDVDFMIVTNQELTDGEVDRVQVQHAQLTSRNSTWVKHLEYSYFSMHKLHELSSPYDATGTPTPSGPRELWKFNNGEASLLRTGHDNTLVTRWTLRHKARAVLGPEPSSFAPWVSADQLRREIQTSMLGWEQRAINDPSEFDNRFHQVFMVLNNCRALQDLHEGRITSKRAGVAWAKQHLDPHWFALIDFCWRERQDTGIHWSQPADPEVFRQTLAFIEYTTRLAEGYRLGDARGQRLKTS